MVISTANENDLKRISVIEEKNFDDSWSYDALKSQFNSPNCIFLTARDKKTIIGYAIFTYVCDEAELLRICVEKRHRRRSVATKLFEEMERIIEDKMIICCFLEVRSSNDAAVAFYTKQGFTTVGKRSGYYAMYNNEDAYLMTKRYRLKIKRD